MQNYDKFPIPPSLFRLCIISVLFFVISVVICIVAALNLMLDFQFISVMSSRGDAPKFMEWYGGFGLLVTIVWLYIEILKLLAKSKRR